MEKVKKRKISAIFMTFAMVISLLPMMTLFTSAAGIGFSFEVGTVTNSGVGTNALTTVNTSTSISVRLSTVGGAWSVTDDVGSGVGTGNAGKYAKIDSLPAGSTITVTVDINNDGIYGDAFILNSLKFGDSSGVGGNYTFKPNGLLTGSEVSSCNALHNFSTFSPSISSNFAAITSLGIVLNAGSTGILLDDLDISPVPMITSAAYNANSGVLSVTGAAFPVFTGVNNDIDASKLTLTGEGGATYTLTDTPDVEISSSTAFSVTLSATDKAAVNQIINKNGTSSTSGTTYNLAASEDWAPGANASLTIADLIGNGVTVSNVAVPTITSATYSSSTGVLVVTGTGFTKLNGAANDINVSKLALSGEGGLARTLTTASVEITSGTSFSVTLNPSDLAAVNLILNKSGTSSASGSIYNLAADEDWAAGADPSVAVADITGNGITVSVGVPTITSATYDCTTGVLAVTGTNFCGKTGSANDIDVTKLAITGEGPTPCTLTSANVEISSSTAFTVTLNATDKTNVNYILNKNGTSSTGGTVYNLAAAEDWAAGADSAVVVVDSSGNGITVSNVAVPTITSATYNCSSGALVVTGTGFTRRNGATNDIVVNKLTITGEGGTTYTLTTASVEITNSTTFSVTLNATDKAAVYLILNKVGTSSTSGSTYNLAAAEDWAAGADPAVNVADLTGNAISATVAQPVITSATYDSSAGTLVVTGTGFVSKVGALNDIDVTKLTLTGEGGATRTLTSDNVETSNTTFTVSLNTADKAAVNQILNKNGLSSASGTTYNLAAAANWAKGSVLAATDLTGNGITVSNVAVPTITNAVYDCGTGVMVVTGTGFLSKSGATNDIVTSKLTITGEGGTTYTLTTASVEITSGTAFSVSLNPTDKAAVNKMLNKNGVNSTSGTIYNLAAAEDWAAGADSTIVVADLTGNDITVSNVAVPTITSATYNCSTGALVVTGTGFLSKDGSSDIDVPMLTISGEGGDTYTLTPADVEIASSSLFTINLNSADKAVVNTILNKNGSSSKSGTTYNLSAADNWATGADIAVNVADMTGNGITVSNVAVPTITSATYNSSTGNLIITGTNFLSKAGLNNDIDVSKLTITGEGGATFNLTTTGADISSGTEFIVNLSTSERAAVNQLLNKSGTSSIGGTLYNLAAAAGWAQGADTSVADTTNSISVSNLAIPAITSAAYNCSTGALVVTGTDFLGKTGAANDIDVTKFTVTGEGGESYSLTSDSVDITSSTEFTVLLNTIDKAAVNTILNKAGTSPTSGAAYNLAAAENWAAGADSTVTDNDLSGNGITVSNVAMPAITSATYNSSTGALVVTGTGFSKLSGISNDIDVTKLTITGEGGVSYTLTTAGTDITSDTEFTVNLKPNPADFEAVNQLLNKSGTSSMDNTIYNLAAAAGWAAGAVSSDADSDNNITASVAAPAITSATFISSTSTLVVTGTGFLKKTGSADIDVSMLSVAGEGGVSYTLTSDDVEISNGTEFTVTLNDADRAEISIILNKNGSKSTGGITYNLSAADHWAAGADSVVNVDDLTGNSITVTFVAIPTITSAAYNGKTGDLVVTGTGFLKLSGSSNDIDVSKLAITGEGGLTRVLTTDSVDITNSTKFMVKLNSADKTVVDQLLNKDGTCANDTTIYNLAAATGWAAGSETSNADATNSITVNNAVISAGTPKTNGTSAAVGTPSAKNIEVNGQKQDGGISGTSINKNGQNVATVTIDDAKLEMILKSNGENPTITFPSDGSNSVMSELSGQAIKELENKEATLEIKTRTVTYVLPASELNIDEVSSQFMSQVALKDIKVNISIAEPSADTVKVAEDTAKKNNYQLVVKPIEFEITCTSGDKTVEVSKFNGYIERTVAIPSGVDPKKITTGVVLNADGTFSQVPTQIVKIYGKYYAKINSFTNSTYSLIYNPVTFADVANHWSKDAVNDMGSRMVVTGMGNGSYEPDRNITRAEFAAVVVRALGLTPGIAENGFKDVNLKDWFNGYVETATDYSLINGYESGSFAPKDTITREQAMAILARAMKLTDLSVSLTDDEVSTLLAKYKDGASVSAYAKNGVAACLKAGIISGMGGNTISPKAYVTRAEVAVMVQRLLQKSGLI